MGRSRYKIIEGEKPHFVTCTTVHWIALFSSQPIVRIILDSLKFIQDRMHQLWQEGSHPQAISSERMMIQKIEYIHYNPVKCGYVDKPEHWRYSSARDYAGMKGLLEISRF